MYCRKPIVQKKFIRVVCSQPAKISKIDVVNHNVNMVQIKKPILNKKTGRIMTYSYRDFSLVTTVKDSQGRTFDNTSSLVFRVKLSDESFGLVGSRPKFPYTFLSQPLPSSIKIPIRETVTIHPNGIIGNLDIQVAVTGYNKEILESVGAPTPEDIPAPPEPFSDDYDDYDYDDEGNFIVSSKNNGVAEEISLTLGNDSAVDLVYDALRNP